MSCALSLYFATLFQERRSDGDDGCVLSPPELVFDNARLPSLLLAGHHPLACGGVGLSSCEVLDSCHTRSTISTCNSTLSANSANSNHSTGSNGSAGSCRWDSNPTSNKEKQTKAAMLLNRPKRPGRKTSDNGKHRSPKQTPTTMTTMVEIQVPLLLESSPPPPQRVNKCDKPQRPSRTLSNGSTNSTCTTSSNASSHHTEKRSNHRRKQPNTSTSTITTTNNNNKELSLDRNHNASHSSASLDKMLLQSKKVPVASTNSCSQASASRDGESSSDCSLNEIFRTAAHQRRSDSSQSIGSNSHTSLKAARIMSPTRTVNEILGQSMEELQISW